ncbi:hypothetical protein [Collinsella sp. An2]|uniref:hypothetical protein n=1 Tax=Collinsella sp. An2 TaxID=1965585 RepID=UPI000B386E25|nr:hypothetical protein [Collinsella sp. An2]OUP09804.1 hypothetical protein B5F33_04245 [Collinsella sp. An2]
MGQYFSWVNFDKNEIIEDWPWANGSKLHESAYLGCEETDAALTMLAGDWAGDFVAFLGDYAEFENETHPKRREIEQRLGDMACEDYIYSCTDICGRFDYTREHPEVRRPVYDGDSIYERWVPYDGPFDVAIHCYRYVVNESKKEFVDRFCTAVRYINVETSEIVRYDPFPELMCSQTGGLIDPEHEIEGLWFGDFIRPTDVHPGSEYKAVAQNYSYWAPPAITGSDEEIRHIIAEHRLNIADKDILEQIYGHLR